MEDFEGGVEGEARTESVDEESEYEVTAKREYEEPKRKRSRRRSIKLRDSSGSPSAGNDVKAASSGVSGGQTNPGEDRGGSEVSPLLFCPSRLQSGRNAGPFSCRMKMNTHRNSDYFGA